MLVAGWSLVAAATEIGPPRHTADDDAPIQHHVYPDEAPVVDVPDLIPTAFPAFSDEMFRFPGWRRTPKLAPVDARTVSRFSGERESRFDYALTVVPDGGRFRQILTVDAESPLWYSNWQLVLLPTPVGWHGTLVEGTPVRLTYDLGSPLAEHRLSFGGRTGKGPRYEILYASNLTSSGSYEDAVTEGWEILDATDPSGNLLETAGISDGRRRRWSVTASFPLPPRMAGLRVETLRAYAGWTSLDERYTLVDHSALDSPFGTLPGLYSSDTFDASGPIVGMTATWTVGRRQELFLDGAIMRTRGGFQRTYDTYLGVAPATIAIDNEGAGWDARIGYRIHRGRSFWEAALGGFSFHHRGGSGRIVYPGPLNPFAEDEYAVSGESESTSFNLTLTAGWRF